MRFLLIGLAIFLGMHSVRIFAEPWRARQVERLGEWGWKGLYSVVSLAGFLTIVHGMRVAQANPTELWSPPEWAAELTAVLALASLVLVAAAYIPGSRIKATLGHPMVLGVALLSFGHLLADSRMHAVVLFGALLLWALIDFFSARGRDGEVGIAYASGRAARDIIVVAVALAAWALIFFTLHDRLFGIAAT